MKKLSLIFFLSAMLMALSLLQPSAWATVTLTNGQWSTTFNCTDWNQGMTSNTLTCDGLSNPSYANTCNGQISHIDSTANYSGGGGGKGWRQYICPGGNMQTGLMQIILNQGVPELWIRWYMKYPSGFSWSSQMYHKYIYFDYNAGSPNVVLDWVWGGSISLYDQEHAVWHYPDHSTCSDGGAIGQGVGWNDINSGWHLYEVHLKKDTNGSNGVFEFWLDGVKKNTHTGINFSGRNFNSFGFLSNQNTVATGGWIYVDDIKVSTTGYIGPVGGTQLPTPAAPTWP